ncbi:hypothetical protein AB2L57_01235 [Microbacterium sp. HA-8]|uniref:hypothetical protein n=1 Tax=unclassified Microbacterium TaxID=2609290 RepID=UPI001E62259E|nr:hypothetical protein [Microbacterium sp. BR1]
MSFYGSITERHHGAAYLMSEHRWAGKGDFALDDMEVRVADTARVHLDEGLAFPGCRHSDPYDLEPRVVVSQNRGLHGLRQSSFLVDVHVSTLLSVSRCQPATDM